MRIAIVDDMKSEQDILVKYLGEWTGHKKHRIPLDIKRFDSSEGFLFYWEEDKKFDLLILDIEMGQINGLELARRIRKEDESIPILFVTGYDEYMQYGYEVAALHYLLKPLQKEKLFMVLDKMQEKSVPIKKLLLITANGPRSVLADGILYVEADGHQCVVHSLNDTFVMKETLSAFEKKVEDQISFIKCHRAYMVNLKCVSMVVKTDVILDQGDKIPVSRNMAKKVNEAFLKYYKSVC